MPVLTLLVAAFLGLQQPSPSSPGSAILTGKVIERSGRPLAGVAVTLEAPPPVTVMSRATGEDGSFRFDNLLPVTYTVKFERSGFVPYTRARLALAAGQSQSMNVALDLGPMVLDVSPAYGRSATELLNLDLAPGEVAVQVDTTVGTFYIAVDTKRAPITSANFLKYVDGKFYDEGRFHRATRPDNYVAAPPNRPMMNIIQGGINPARRSEGFPAIPLERTSVTGIKHVTGVVSMARGTPDSATSDFFVLLDDQPSLDFGGLRFDDGQGGAAFGRVVGGLDVVRRIQQQPVDGQNLSGPVRIVRVRRLTSS